jgi:hypothetical protein
MVKKSEEGAFEGESEAPLSGSRPVRRAQKTKGASRSRKRRRKSVNIPGGIHQRANKRMSW